MLQNRTIGVGRDGEGQILNIFKYGHVVCQNEHTEMKKIIQLKNLTSKVISRSFWGHKYAKMPHCIIWHF